MSLKPDTLAIAMIACSRPELDIQEAVRQVRNGGFGETLHLFCEPGMAELEPLQDVAIHRNASRLGVLGNWHNSLRWLVDHTDADYLMICEDDVAYCRGARSTWAAAVEIADRVGFWSLYTPVRDRCLVGHTLGWTASNRGRDTWGTQALCFPRRSAEVLLQYQPLYDEDQLRGPTDAIVAQCFVDARIPCYYHNPSLADHIGRVSSIGHNWQDEHVGLNFDPDYFPADSSPSSLP